MRKPALFTTFILAAALFTPAQEPAKPTPRPAELEKSEPAENATYGRIKEVEDKKKIVIKVDGGRDRTYDLSDPKAAIRVAESLAIGDPVKILETKLEGGTSVQIVRDTRTERERRSK